MQRIIAVVVVSLLTIFSVSAQDSDLEIIASHSILADVVTNIAGDGVTVSSLIPAGADPHNFQPTPRELTGVADADLMFINGGQFEEGLLDTIENVADSTQIEIVSACVEVRSFEGHDHEDEHHDEHGEDEHDEEHDDEHSDEEHHDDEHSDEEHHDDGHDDMHSSEMSELCEEHHAVIDGLVAPANIETIGTLQNLECDVIGHSDEHVDAEHDEDEHSDEEHDDHDHGVCDPHVWTVPQNVMLWTLYIRDVLIEIDPTNADAYTANADAYLAELVELNDEFIVPMLATIPEENRILVTNHDSMGYFADAYGFEILTTVIPGGSTIADPSPAEVVEVIERIQEEGITAIFTENTVNDRLANQIASETDAEIYLLYSGALSDADGEASTYLDYMRYNVSIIVSALGN